MSEEIPLVVSNQNIVYLYGISVADLHGLNNETDFRVTAHEGYTSGTEYAVRDPTNRVYISYLQGDNYVYAKCFAHSRWVGLPTREGIWRGQCICR